jgi:hypothetical protein
MRLLRNYSNDWVHGGGRFAALYLPYLIEYEGKNGQKQQAIWRDTQDAGKGGLPSGLAEIEDDEATGAIHPALDPDLSGMSPDQKPASNEAGTGRKSEKQYRSPLEYLDVVNATGTNLPKHLIVARYYKELAVPHLIKFPVREVQQATDPLPEGLETWDMSTPLEKIDWMGTLVASPVVIPGFTTREREYGTSPGSSPETEPLDLYLGVDCSGSMPNPSLSLSYPILAAAVIALSALRARANVMVVLSGEPGQTVSTNGFVRDENAVLTTLTGYLGTGTTFGIHRLQPVFSTLKRNHRPIHILIITDSDIFMMLNGTDKGYLGWDVARNAAAEAKGGATYVLQIPFRVTTYQDSEERMRRDGWNTTHVNTMQELLVFARQFSKEKYQANSSAPKLKTEN